MDIVELKLTLQLPLVMLHPWHYCQYLSMSQIATIASQEAGVGIVAKPYPSELQQINIGSYHSSSTRLAEEFGWHPKVHFLQGVQQTLAYFRLHLNSYLEPRDWPQAQAVLANVPVALK